MLARKQFLTVMVSLMLLVPCLGAWGQTRGCQTGKDWQDIYILPTNGDYQTNIRITLTADKQQVRPGDTLSLSIQADRDCWITLMDMGTSGRIIRLWPNDYTGTNNKVQANAARNFPELQDGFQYRVGGPDGVERIIAYATSEPGKILSEQEFQAFHTTKFKQFVGGAKDLADCFQRNAKALSPGVCWGTAQVNVCIGTGVTPTTSPGPTPIPGPTPAPTPTSGPTPTSTPPPSPGPGPPAGQRMFVVAIGAQTEGLKYCNRDAEQIVETFKQRMGVQAANVRLIAGNQATYDQVSAAMQWLASSTRPEDSAVIFYSGHGSQIPDQAPLDEVDGKDECFVLAPGARKGENYKELLRRKILLVDDQMNLMLKAIPARKKILMVDACHSGTIDKSLGALDGEYTAKYLPLSDPDQGKEIWDVRPKSVPTNYGNDNEALLSACLDNEISWEFGELKAGVFTHFLIKAINEGTPTLEEAFSKAKAGVVQYLRQKQQANRNVKGQTPQLTDPHGLVKLIRFGR